MSGKRETPCVCGQCYWLLSGCEPLTDACECEWFEPAGFDDDGDTEYEREPEYGTEEETEDRWSDGYEIFESAEAMVRYFRRDC